jgi:hypothetical protein
LTRADKEAKSQKNGPAAKAIRPEPRRVQKAIAYQFERLRPGTKLGSFGKPRAQLTDLRQIRREAAILKN